MIKTVIFDIDNTLYDYNLCHEETMVVITDYFYKNFGYSPEKTMMIYNESRELMRKRINSDVAAIHNRLIGFQFMLEMMEQPPFPHGRILYELYWDTMLKKGVPMPGIKEYMEMLKKENIRIGVGTDMTSDIQYRKLECLKLAPYIDFVVTSEECGVEKPHPHFFKICLEKAKCRPEECAFIGDHLKKDVLGAINNGMHGILYTNGKANSHEEIPAISDYRLYLKDTKFDFLNRK